MISHDKAEKVLEILENDSSSLKYLAYISGVDPFYFYRASDLTRLDLSDQDLKGLNFDQADLRMANLSRVDYDKGAFNNALMPLEFLSMTDSFDSYFDDLETEDIGRIYLFIRIREGLIDDIKKITKLQYSNLAEIAGISSATLRKARRGEAIALDTAKGISTIKAKFLDNMEGRRQVSDIFKQPCIQFLRMNYSGGFTQIGRADFFKYIEIARRIYARRTEDGPKPYLDNWRDGPVMLDWYNTYYFDSPMVLPPPPLEYKYPPTLPLDFGLFASPNDESE